jgi:flagellar biosynthesis/type III secretory pathway chaperone
MTDLSTNALAELMVKRRKCLTQLRDLGLRQAELIAEGEISDLLKLIGAKQQLIVALQALEKRLAPFHEQDADKRQWESIEARVRCAADAETCRRLIDEVMTMEQEGEIEMTRRRDELAGQLRVVASGGRVREAYQANR